MLRLIGRRLALAVPLVVGVSVLTFTLGALVPGDPAYVILGANATPEAINRVNHELGFDQPIPVQYWNWLRDALGGDLGTSLSNSQPVSAQLLAQLPVTLSLVAGATLISSIAGVALGVAGALLVGGIGRLVDSMAMLGFAVPVFWLGLVLIEVFALDAQLLPATGYNNASPSEWVRSLLLPWVTLSMAGVTGIAKQTRDAMRIELSRDYIDMLRASGIAEWRIVWMHALRNAAIPAVTMIGLFFVSLLSGAVVVETVFGLPGLGSLAVTATLNHDLPVLQGVTIIFCLLVVAVNLVVDLAYGWLNPKARVQ